MRPSIFLHLKKGLICTAMLSIFALSGCQMVSDYFPSTQKTPEQSTSDVSSYQAIIDAAQGKPSMEALRAYISQEPLLKTAAERQANIDGLWKMLTQLTPEQVHGIEADEYILQGWVDLLDIYQNNQDDPDALRTGFNDWKMRYSNNPGATIPPTQLLQAMLPRVGTTPKIALFLPMSGQGQVFGQAIMQGFMDAQKGLPQTTSLPANTANAQSSGNDILDQIYAEVAATTGEAPATTDNDLVTSALRIDATPTNTQTIKVFDTTNQQMPQLLEQAKNEGFNLVVGPLLKTDVNVIAQMGAPVSVLALNELDSNQLQPRPNLCYFSLSPEDEAQNAAAYMRSEGKQMPLVLVPANAFGDRIAKAFAKGWQEKGGSTVLMQTFGSVPSLKESINRGAGIRMTGTPVNTGETVSPQLSPQIEDSTGAIDGVYIVATRDELTLIKPMIEMAISTRSRPALYTSSRSNQAGSGADYRFEMDGVKFSEVPLLAGANNSLRKQAQQKLNNDYSLFRLYAMGVDAWSLANNFDKLQQPEQLRINGASGVLTTTPNCVVFRELPWLQFKQGKILPAQ
ncbi:penicillin-binding protein activator [Providencia sp. CRE-3FA-0001]|uniref:Penicillin-binding protein activator n=2 Tax=Providencia huashanensis TaxID=3037798 RepID=A0AA42FQY7_9GAMM|nr:MULTISPECIES: penicillin-binding protein activator [Providencia]EIL1981381.1 penicillin-binding protein activator [Providencia rettgeri]EIU9513577.1 penicillin-binding protein activator [Providencia rettgeri]EJD6410056.1 penicillin-binding protein activator [Providencia rettgeri]EJD6583429.1 penicillin-binding protein activator [Providencia rettgeri]EJD6613411.1 penicillin-binding protein activator [Providencia rettgeri]